MKQLKMLVLVDNNGTEALPGEWGLSIWLEYKDKKVLLDAGASSLVITNAKTLGVDLADIDYAVLSHAHYDHADGFKSFFECNEKAKLYIGPGCRENCYKVNEGELEYIGVALGILDAHPDRICRVDKLTEVFEGMYLLPHTTAGLSKIGRVEKMYQKTDQGMVPDNFSHEQSLIFETEDGLVIFNSCSHAGADLIIEEVRNALPGKKLLAMIGGFHLFNKTEEQVREFANRINATGIQTIVTGHCTGDEAFEILKEMLGDKVIQFHTGLSMEF